MSKKIIIFLIFTRVIILFGTYLLVILVGRYHLDSIKFIEAFAGRWDGNSYTFIASHGYVTSGDEAAFIVFPPIYPALIRLFGNIGGNYHIAGVLISNTLFVVGAYIFYKLLSLDYPKKFATKAIILLSVFPTSYFFSTDYPESTFLFLWASIFYLYRKNFHTRALIPTSLVTITRPFGILTWPALGVEWLLSKRKKTELIYFFIFAAIPVVVYLGINYFIYGNPLAFQTYLKNVWSKSFSLPWNAIVGSLKRSDLVSGPVEGISAIILWAAIPLMLFKKIRPSYLTYYVLGVFMATSTSFLLSTPRYILSLPPFFITLTFLLENKILLVISCILFSVVLLFLSYNFALGRWAF